MSHYVGEDLAVDLTNTYDVHGEEELLGTVAALAVFARDHGFDASSARGSDLQRIRNARPLLRRAMLAGDEDNAVTVLNELLASTKPLPRLVPCDDGWHFAYADPEADLGDRLIGEAAAQLLHEIREHGMSRFSTCASSTCDDVFVDQSRNHSRRYCTSDVCGNREAQRAYRARRGARSEGAD